MSREILLYVFRYNPEQEALDVLHIDVTDMNVTSKRQVEEEVKAKLTPDLKRKTVIKKVSSGPSLAKLKLSRLLHIIILNSILVDFRPPWLVWN